MGQAHADAVANPKCGCEARGRPAVERARTQSPMKGDKSPKKDKNYSWKGSPNAGLVLAVAAVVGGLLILLSGFLG